MSETFLIILLLVFSAFFSASELAVASIPLYKIKQLLNSERNYLPKILLKLKKNIEKTIIALLIWNNAINVLISIIASRLWDSLIAKLALWWAIWLFIVSSSITLIILIFGEILPKIFATKNALKLALFLSPVINIICYIFSPLTYLLVWLTKILNLFFPNTVHKVSKDDVEIFVEQWEKDWIFTEIESNIIKNFLYFDERDVASILRHRTEVFAISNELTIKDSLDLIFKNNYSRIPVFQWDKDNIIWILTIRDFLTFFQSSENLDKKIKDFPMRKIYKIPITAKIFNVFLDMKKQWQHFALIIDEYWGTAWIITLEDILEDMLWEIRDEFDIYEESPIKVVSNNEIIIQWNVLLREVLDYFKINYFPIPKEYKDDVYEEDMISYIILNILKSFAKKWDKIQLLNLVFEVLEIKADKISTVRVIKSDNK